MCNYSVVKVYVNLKLLTEFIKIEILCDSQYNLNINNSTKFDLC